MQPAAVRWGILATGSIAHSFARDLREVRGAALAAVGSRSAESAAELARSYGAEGCRAHGSYQALVADPDVDVVYVASPHVFHLEHARMALVAGKHVLCEKPLTVNRAEAEEMVALAVRHDRFLMEAMWTACHPVVRAVVAGLDAGRFGTPRQLHADFGFATHQPPGHRLLDPALGGGALLDLGVYPLTLAELLLGPVETAVAVASLDDRGVDRDVAIATRHPGGAVGALSCSLTADTPTSAALSTDTGVLHLPTPLHHPPYALWTPSGGETERIEGDGPVLGTGLGNEAAEVGRCLADGLRESPLVPHDRTLRLLGQMDGIRRQVGVRYPADG
ncbi:Gfo/Idh/MocA family protein [Nocardioides sp. GXQ0305]|uniref:Gfo/Idh/MocA family protein n=1 Tax=Nocardioides sp. GXQ0305 TaxID=3423912 RepID=UPI003D7C59B0